VVVRHPASAERAIGWITVDPALLAALAGLGRKLPHYGKYSYLGFAGAEPTNKVKGQWAATDSPLRVDLRPLTPEAGRDHRSPPLPPLPPLPALVLEPRRALAELAPTSSGHPAPAAQPAPLAQSVGPALVVVRLTTALGEIDLEVDNVRAPVSAANFLRSVDAGRYDGGRFHRTVRPDTETRKEVAIEVIQGGVAPEREKDEFPPIPLERTSVTGLKHRDGTLSMARAEPDTATSDFFLCVGDQPSLDFGGARNPDGQGFAAFGRVVRGMEVVRQIQAAPAQGQVLTPPIAILSARRLP
jgi:peptidyl-prolyl cis-trans isomerase A (cyclophilin A)